MKQKKIELVATPDTSNQLSDWCMNYLAQNYNAICRKFPKVLRNLLPENQAALNLNRWPPVW